MWYNSHMKKCKVCLVWKSLEDYPNDKSRSDGKHPYCKLCRSEQNKKYIQADPARREKRRRRSYEWKLKNPERYKLLINRWKADNGERKAFLDKKSQLWTHYRLTVEDYLEMVDSQKGLCAVCGSGGRLYVDHDHSCCSANTTCGKCVRGLLCQKCNMFMHYIDEYSQFITPAQQYAKGRAGGGQ